MIIVILTFRSVRFACSSKDHAARFGAFTKFVGTESKLVAELLPQNILLFVVPPLDKLFFLYPPGSCSVHLLPRFAGLLDALEGSSKLSCHDLHLVELDVSERYQRESKDLHVRIIADMIECGQIGQAFYSPVLIGIKGLKESMKVGNGMGRYCCGILERNGPPKFIQTLQGGVELTISFPF